MALHAPISDYERNLISALCTSAGMRATIPKDKVDGFLKNVSTLDPDVVCPILEDFLSDEAWQVRKWSVPRTNVASEWFHLGQCKGTSIG